MATIKKVADLAGVSVGTVSHVLTGSAQVSESLRLKVQAAIRDLDYHPNHVARSLKTSRTKTLGIIVPDLTIPFFPQVIRGAESAARERGYSLLAVNSTESGDRQKELLSLLRSQRVEGILLIMAAAPAPTLEMSQIADAGIPLVCLDRIPDKVPVDSVCVEDLAAAEMGIDHLISNGYRRIAIVTGPLSLKNEQRRLLGYKAALKRSALAHSRELIWEGNLRTDDVAAMCRTKLESMKVRPDALFCTNGPTALGALRGLRDCGLKTPDDMGFVTFDELTLDDLFTPAITAVVQPAYEIGFRASEILLQRIDTGKTDQIFTERLSATLKVRTSSRPLETEALAGKSIRPILKIT
jgi:LacI family transcriptional regulator